MLDRHGLVGNERRFDPDWQVGPHVRHGLPDIAPERHHVATFAHGDREPDAISSVNSKYRLRGVGGAARYVRDVA